MNGGKDNPKDVTVGSGITSYRREETLYDSPHINDVRASEDVPASVRMDPARPIVNLRWEIEETCQRIFSDHQLPTPLSMIDPNGVLDPVDWTPAVSKGAEHIESLGDAGYFLAAHYHCPSEDHSELWYAARMAIVLAQIDVKTSLIRAFPEHPEEISLLTQCAVELGRLECEFRMKFAHEDSAQLGYKVKSGGAAGAKHTAMSHADRTAEVLANMKARIEDGQSVSDAARFAQEQDGLGTSPKANSKLWYRHVGNRK